MTSSIIDIYRKSHRLPDLQFEDQKLTSEFKVMVTNKPLPAKKVLVFHNGRDSQDGVFAKLKSQAKMGYMPTRRRAGNQIYLLAGVLAHNLNRDIQMRCHEPARNTTEKPTPLW